MEKFRFMDSEGKNIYVYKWAPKEEDIKGVIQIAHGMTETALRYSYFAEKLNDAGFVVYVMIIEGMEILHAQKKN